MSSDGWSASLFPDSIRRSFSKHYTKSFNGQMPKSRIACSIMDFVSEKEIGSVSARETLAKR
jgi:hypothetical protein